MNSQRQLVEDMAALQMTVCIPSNTWTDYSVTFSFPMTFSMSVPAVVDQLKEFYQDASDRGRISSKYSTHCDCTIEALKAHLRDGVFSRDEELEFFSRYVDVRAVKFPTGTTVSNTTCDINFKVLSKLRQELYIMYRDTFPEFVTQEEMKFNSRWLHSDSELFLNNKNK